MKRFEKNTSRILTIVFLLIASVLFVFGTSNHLNQDIFWDLHIYQLAVENYKSNLNPYTISSSNLFIYHPLVLQAFSLVGNSISLILGVLYTFVSLLFLLSLAKRRELFAPFFLSFSFLGLGVLSITTGNITLFLNFVLLTIILESSDSKSSYSLFNATVFLFAIIKPYMLAYLAIPCLVSFRKGKRVVHELRKALGWIIFFVLVVAIHSAIFSNLFLDFYNALKAQTFIKGDLGISIYSYMLQIFEDQRTSLLLHYSFWGICSLFIFRFFFLNKHEDHLSFILALYFILSLLNPRLKEYDVPPMLFALFSSALLVSKNIKDLLFIGLANIPPLININVQNGYFSKPGVVLYSVIALLVIFFIRAKSKPTPLVNQSVSKSKASSAHTAHTYRQT